MTLRLRDITLRLSEDETLLPEKAAARLSCSAADLEEFRILRKSVDARRKPDVLRIYTVEFACPDEAELLSRQPPVPGLEQSAPLPLPEFFHCATEARVLVVGMGPAGLFAALVLAEAGLRVTLLERGRPLKDRIADVERFWSGGALDPDSNIQFGEGGAGTFSDGKLTSRGNYPEVHYVLQRLVEFGAPPEVLYESRPHIGSDRLRRVLLRFRGRLQELGVEVRFSDRLSDLELSGRGVVGGVINDRDLLPCDYCVLALGHSARDTYEMLERRGVCMERKAFAVGVRIEHPRELINRIQYGMSEHPRLPAADYRLAWNDRSTGRGVYSFCMCPGGAVINAASEAERLVVNGMSDYHRAAPFSNSALLVTVRPEDFSGSEVLAGIVFQRRWEEAAYRCGTPGWRAPAQPVLEFLGRPGGQALRASCRPEVVHADLHDCLPGFVTDHLRSALPRFAQRMRGFVGSEAVLIGVETRSSAPVRLLRDCQGESCSHAGLFPAGEGAGYAGGIMSAAVDGIRAARSICRRCRTERSGTLGGGLPAKAAGAVGKHHVGPQ